MIKKWNEIILASTSILIITSCTNLDPAKLGTQAASAALGYAVGDTQSSNFKEAGAVGAAAGALIGDFAYEKVKENKVEKKTNEVHQAYIDGRNFERWGNAKKHWGTYTLDPNTGDPIAFSGLDFNKLQNNSEEAIGSTYNTSNQRASGVLPEAKVIPVIIEEGDYNGVNRSKRTLLFPKL